MATTKGLTFEIHSYEGGPTVTVKQASQAVAKIMQRFGVPRVPHERFDQSTDSIVSDAALMIGNPQASWEYDGEYTIIFDYTNLSISNFNANIVRYNSIYGPHHGPSIAKRIER